MLTLGPFKSKSWLGGKDKQSLPRVENVHQDLLDGLLYLARVAEHGQQYHVNPRTKRLQSVEYRFEFVEDGLLGVGSFGRVILARDHQDHSKYVAVKVLEAEKLLFDRHLQKGLRREIDLLSQLKHENIVEFIGLFVMKGYICMAMECIPGGDLYEAIKELSGNPIRESVARDILSQVLSATLYMHSTGIVHRDLKLENILLDWCDGDLIKAKVADFGLSRTFEEGQKMSTQCGSHDYAPPEIHLGLPYDGRLVDAWSFGVVMFALLCGRLPFPDDHTMSRCIVQGKFSVDQEGLSPEAKEIIEALLCPDPDQRLSLQDLAKYPFFSL